MDTSAFVKLFLTEAGSAAMTVFAIQENDENKIVCALASVEARSALVKLHRMKRLTSDQLAIALSILDEELNRIAEQPITSAVLRIAGTLVERHSLRAIDAVQLASAIVVRNHGSEVAVRFIGSDRDLLEAAESEGFQVWDPAKP